MVETKDLIGEVAESLTTGGHGKGSSNGFQSMKLMGKLLRAVMKQGYRLPTPIQRKVIPEALAGKDIVAMARTGSGKSAAYLIPMIQKLKEHSATVGVRAIIVVPTRELALQTSKFTADLAKFTDLRQAVVLGGESLNDQFSLLANNPDILIATPGRLNHIIELTKLSLQRVHYVVFDEADQLFELGLFDQVMQLVKILPETRQTLLISATLPNALVEFSKVGLNNPSVFRLDVDNSLSELLKLSFFVVRSDEKYAMLMHSLSKVVPMKEQALVFVSTKYHVELLYKMTKLAGFTATFIFGEMDPTARKENLGRFRSGHCRFCFVTDVAARGIDIPRLENVINFDFPCRPKLFVHRVGRVARAGRPGKAISILTPDEIPYMVDLHTFLGYKLQNQPEDWDGSQYIEEPLKPCYGKVTSSILETEVESVRNLFQSHGKDSDELQNIDGVCKKAFKLYSKMRSAASPSAVKQAKSIIQAMDLHPVFLTKLDDTAKQQNDLIASIHKFKAKSTIFELGKTSDLMHQRRVVRENILNKEILRDQEQAAILEEETRKDTDGEVAAAVAETTKNKKRQLKQVKPVKTDFKDPNFFMSTDLTDQQSFKEGKLKVKDSEGSNMHDYTLDLDGDDATSIMRKKRQVRKWDPKKKKFVTEQFKNPNKEKKKEEEKEGKEKANPYLQWKKKSRQIIPMTGTKEDTEHENSDVVGKMRKAKSRFREHKNSGSTLDDEAITIGTERLKSGKRVKNELQSAENILKKRKMDARKAERSGGAAKKRRVK